eukprot:1192973-Prorocentrum_minimum.AAC.3
MMIVYVWYNSTSSYGSACANDGKDALNTPETLCTPQRFEPAAKQLVFSARQPPGKRPDCV